MTERVLSQVQVAEMGFLQRAHGVTLRHSARSCEIRRALNVQPLPELRDPSYVGAASAICPEYFRKDWWGKFFWLHPQES